MSRGKKKKKHRFFWLMIKLQIILIIMVVAGIIVYKYGGYADQLQALRTEAVKLVRESNEKTFIPAQTSVIYALFAITDLKLGFAYGYTVICFSAEAVLPRLSVTVTL